MQTAKRATLGGSISGATTYAYGGASSYFAAASYKPRAEQAVKILTRWRQLWLCSCIVLRAIPCLQWLHDLSECREEREKKKQGDAATAVAAATPAESVVESESDAPEPSEDALRAIVRSADSSGAPASGVLSYKQAKAEQARMASLLAVSSHEQDVCEDEGGAEMHSLFDDMD